MPVSLRDPEREVIAALFYDDPRNVLKFLEDLAFEQAKSEPEYAKTWKKVAEKIHEAHHATKPLY